MSDGFFLDKHKQANRGSAACKARWLAEDWRISLDLILGSTSDVSMYADCIASAREQGSRMTTYQRAEARWLASNPK